MTPRLFCLVAIFKVGLGILQITSAKQCPQVWSWFGTVGTINIGTNPSEPTTECGLGNSGNPSEPTTLLPSPQYGKAEASEISNTFC